MKSNQGLSQTEGGVGSPDTSSGLGVCSSNNTMHFYLVALLYPLRSCRSSSVSFFWGGEGNLAGNLAGILRDFFGGKFGGNFAGFFRREIWREFSGIFSDPQNRGSKKSGKTSEHFCARKFVPRKTYFVPTSFCRRATVTRLC